jgi:hypothetical protein
MSKIVQRTYNTINNRHKIYRAVFGKWLTKEEISEITKIGTPNSVRSMCDTLIINGYLKKVDSYNKVVKRWAVKYSAVIEKPFIYRSYEDLLAEYNKSKENGGFQKDKGIYDDLIAKNPNLRVIKQTDTKVQASWRRKPTSYYRGIASTLNMGD